MPKQTRPGGRYTTGIKRNRHGGYGGQTYGRRGCGFILYIPFAAAAIEAVRHIW